MYIYMVTEGEELKIHTPDTEDLSKVKKKQIVKPDCILLQLDYPSGLHLEIETHADRIIFYSNRPWNRNPDGSFTAPSA